MGKQPEAKDMYGWDNIKKRGWFTDRERKRLRRDNLALWCATFVDDLCNREREILNDPEIPDDWGRHRVVIAHRTNAREQLMRTFLNEMEESDWEGEHTEGFTPVGEY